MGGRGERLVEVTLLICSVLLSLYRFVQMCAKHHEIWHFCRGKANEEEEKEEEDNTQN